VRPVDALDEATIAIVFADDAASLREVLAAHGDRLNRPSTLWIAYPKGNRTDINRDTLWPMVTPYGVRPNGQVSVDDAVRAAAPGRPGGRGSLQRRGLAVAASGTPAGTRSRAG
jgi:hypothetical protein